LCIGRAAFNWWEELGPSGVFGGESYASQDWLSNYRVSKIKGFGGRPPVGGRPGARPP